MKTGQVFWGILLLTVGTLFLLDNLSVDSIAVEWEFLSRLWPVLIILWGVSALVANKYIKALLAAAAALLLGFLLYGFFSFQWISHEHGVFRTEEVKPRVFTEPLLAGVTRGSLSVKTGAARLRIDGATDQLLEAETRSTFGEYELTKEREGSEVSFELALLNHRGEWTLGRLKNEANVHLHPDPVWDVECELGAASAKLDLSELAVDRVEIESGAASIRLRLGDRAEQCDVSINSGASSIRVEIPESVGCRVEVRAPLSSKKFHGFQKYSRNEYRTEGYETSERKVFISFDVGVSALTIQRY